MRLAFSLAYPFIWDSFFKIYIFQHETACHNSDSHFFKLISSAITAELLVLGQTLEKTSNHKNEPPASTDEISANELQNKIYQTIYSTRNRICKSTPGRISFEQFSMATYNTTFFLRLFVSQNLYLFCFLK